MFMLSLSLHTGSSESATFSCINLLLYQPFVRSAGQCQEMCQKKRKCGYYKFIHGQWTSVDVRGGFEIIPKREQPIYFRVGLVGAGVGVVSSEN